MNPLVPPPSPAPKPSPVEGALVFADGIAQEAHGDGAILDASQGGACRVSLAILAQEVRRLRGELARLCAPATHRAGPSAAPTKARLAVRLPAPGPALPPPAGQRKSLPVRLPVVGPRRTVRIIL